MIAFSGIDCAGKSTQLEIFSHYLEGKNIKYKVIWSRGGYTSWVERIKTLIRRDKDFSENEKDEYRNALQKSSQKMKLLLWASICDLIRFYGIVFRWIEFTGTQILCDRYLWDTYIDFQMKYPDIDFEKWFCWKLLLKVYKKPDCAIVFTIPADESMRRSALKNDIHAEKKDFLIRRIRCYEDAIKKHKWEYVIDAQKPIDEIADQVKHIAKL